MKKSGLADSPFFTLPPQKVEATPPLVSTSPQGNDGVATPLSTDVQTNLEKHADQTSQGYTDNVQAQKRTSVPSYDRTEVRTYERTRTKTKRRKIRHAFDIFEDQLRALQILQFEAVQKGRKKPKLGKMVQDAIDLYLQKRRETRKQG